VLAGQIVWAVLVDVRAVGREAPVAILLHSGGDYTILCDIAFRIVDGYQATDGSELLGLGRHFGQKKLLSCVFGGL